MTPEIINGICQHIDNDAASKVLWVSASSADVPEGISSIHCQPDINALEKHKKSQFSYAVLCDLPGAMSRPTAEALIAKMRDVNAQKVFWVIDASSPWTNKDALALGFHQLQLDKDSQLYGFDINNYKSTPEWLNAKHWANPEQWDKNRW